VGKRTSAYHCTMSFTIQLFSFSGKFCILATKKNWLQMVLEGIFMENMGQFHHIMRKTRPMLPYLNDKFSMSPTCNKIPSQICSQISLSPLLHGCQPTYLTNLKKKTLPLHFFEILYLNCDMFYLFSPSSLCFHYFWPSLFPLLPLVY
jgi:hypothetical protein